MASGKPSSSVWVVAHLSPRKHGSMEDQVVAIARRLAELGASLTYVFAGPPAPWLAEALRTAGARVKTLDYTRPFEAARTLLGWLLAARPDVVHFHFVRAHSPLVAAARLAGAQVLVNDHMHLTRLGTAGLRDRLKRLRAFVLSRLFDVVHRRIAVSRAVADSVIDAEHVAPDKVVVIENGIDVDRARGVDGQELRRELGLGSRPIIACVSRLSEEKGVISAIRMMTDVAEAAVLLLVGDGPDEKELRSVAAGLGLGDRVRFLGLRDDVERILAAADVVVVPSHCEEAFGLAMAEGMAAGRPLVVSRSGAMPELVGDGGLVVPKKDPRALAAAVSRLLADPALRDELGRAGRRRAAERFSMARYVDAVCGLYLGTPRPSAHNPAR